MSFLDKIKDKIVPDTSNAPISTSTSGIGNARGAMGFDDDMIVSKPAIIFFTSQIFFNFLAMCCFASVASFQGKWGVGPSGLTGFALFLSIAGIFLSLFLMLVPVAYEKYGKFPRLARALKEVRATFVLVGMGAAASFLIAFITTISAWTEPGCKDPSTDPNASKGSDFQNGLPGWCSTKKAGAVFFWLTAGFWGASIALAVLDWRNGKANRPRDPPFTHPDMDDDVENDGDSTFQIPPIRRMTDDDDPSSPFSDTNRYSGASVPPSGTKYNVPSAPQPRPSIDAYGAFSDPEPSGFGAPSQDNGTSGVSRTMQYADPYAAVRATVTSAPRSPPGYQSPGYQGYS